MKQHPDLRKPDSEKKFKKDLNKLKKDVADFPWWGVAGIVILALISVIIIAVFLKRMILVVLAVPFLALGLLVGLRMVWENTEMGSQKLLDIFFTPYWCIKFHEYWHPAMAWFLAALICGFLLRSSVNGLAVGIAIPLFPWLWKVMPSNGWDMLLKLETRDLLAEMAKTSMVELPTMIFLTVLGCMIGGALSPFREKKVRR